MKGWKHEFKLDAVSICISDVENDQLLTHFIVKLVSSWPSPLPVCQKALQRESLPEKCSGQEKGQSEGKSLDKWNVLFQITIITFRKAQIHIHSAQISCNAPWVVRWRIKNKIVWFFNVHWFTLKYWIVVYENEFMRQWNHKFW